MSTAMTERPTGLVASVTPEQLELVKRTVANGATPDELKLYLYDCARQGVHPLDKLLHFTKRGGKYTPVTSIDLMRVRAAETGEYAGSDDAVFDDVGGTWKDGQPVLPEWARVTVWRLVQGQRCAFTATARWAEYYPGDQAGTMWRKMPHTMLAKCAEALALRKGFPRQLAGLYAKEELDQAGESHGYSVSAPAEPMLVKSPKGEPITANLTSAGPTQSVAPDVTRPPTGGSAPPAGCYRIVQVQKQTGKVKGEVILVDHHGQEQKLPAFQDQLVALAERLCQDGVPVEADIKVAGTSQKPYLKNLRAALPEIQVNADVHTQPLTDADIPF